MKIALFVHCFFPEHFYGTESYTLQIAKSLQAVGHDVTVVTGVFQGEPRRSALVTSYRYEDVSVVAIDKNYLPHSRIRETYYQEEMAEPLRDVITSLMPDIVHVTHLVNHTAVLLDVLRALKIPVVATLTDFFGFCYNSKLEAANGSLCVGPNALRSNCLACHLRAVGTTGNRVTAALGMLPFGLAAAGFGMRLAYAAGMPGRLSEVAPDIVERPTALRSAYSSYRAMVAPTEFLRDAYARNGLDDGRLVLSRFGVDIDRRSKPERSPGHTLTIGFIGQLAAHKGTHLLIEAARSLPSSSIRLLIYGPTNQDPIYMEQLRRRAGPETEFRGTFPSERMAEIMAELDLLCIPSIWYENSPLVLLNALATHTPVLVSNVKGLTELIKPGVDGWTFKLGDVRDLTRVLSDLAKNPQVVFNASKKTRYTRSIADMGTEVDALYRNTLSGGRIGHSFPRI